MAHEAMTDHEFSSLATRHRCVDCGGYVANHRAMRCASCNLAFRQIRASHRRETLNGAPCERCGKPLNGTTGKRCSTCNKYSTCATCGYSRRKDRGECPKCNGGMVKEACSKCGQRRILTGGMCNPCSKFEDMRTGDVARFECYGYTVTADVIGYATIEGEKVCDLLLPATYKVIRTPIDGLEITKQ